MFFLKNVLTLQTENVKPTTYLIIYKKCVYKHNK